MHLTSIVMLMEYVLIGDFCCFYELVPTALSLDGQFSIIGANERDISHFVREIEQHDYLLEDSPTGEQLRKYVIYVMKCHRYFGTI